jgi:hypothetical protein
MGYTFNEFEIPDDMMPLLLDYVQTGKDPGYFLTAVICNDLKGAVREADDENMRNLPAYVAYLYNEAPQACHGSKENMNRWTGV